MVREDIRRIPVEPVWWLVLRPAGRADLRPLAGLQMNPAHAAVLALEIDLIGVVRIDAGDVAVAAAGRDPVLVDRPAGAVQVDARPAPTAVILQAAENPVGLLRAQGDVVELADREMVQVVPVRAAVVGAIEPAVAADDHVAAVLRVDPEGVAVGVHAPTEVAAEGLAAVRGAVL